MGARRQVAWNQPRAHRFLRKLLEENPAINSGPGHYFPRTGLIAAAEPYYLNASTFFSDQVTGKAKLKLAGKPWQAIRVTRVAG